MFFENSPNLLESINLKLAHDSRSTVFESDMSKRKQVDIKRQLWKGNNGGINLWQASTILI